MVRVKTSGPTCSSLRRRAKVICTSERKEKRATGVVKDAGPECYIADEGGRDGRRRGCGGLQRRDERRREERTLARSGIRRDELVGESCSVGDHRRHVVCGGQFPEPLPQNGEWQAKAPRI